MATFLENFFRLKENGTDVKTEILAGITTFMTMAYILAVNPGILKASGMDAGAVFTATAIGACVGTLMMAFFSNYPFALAPGMGLNAFFCIYGSRSDGVFMASCFGCGICRRNFVYHSLSH